MNNFRNSLKRGTLYQVGLNTNKLDFFNQFLKNLNTDSMDGLTDKELIDLNVGISGVDEKPQIDVPMNINQWKEMIESSDVKLFNKF